ncbi:hypothetical protein IQ266_10175 [filamentous cyanobacterium LEGE 11480]|uniref:Uncharacterized protein n=1 Tax=Romeriopsis navalis LEGE 11480 TaxID=2777977 RepID=A0A928Z2Z5_9CYAN|nr:hypothetical protein [Romeriopsis navalis]MBE9030094.1 hypothetical protein [Romeriopsis navalis LEGE 11480]
MHRYLFDRLRPFGLGILAVVPAFLIGVGCTEMLFIRPLQQSVSHGIIHAEAPRP